MTWHLGKSALTKLSDIPFHPSLNEALLEYIAKSYVTVRSENNLCADGDISSTRRFLIDCVFKHNGSAFIC